MEANTTFNYNLDRNYQSQVFHAKYMDTLISEIRKDLGITYLMQSFQIFKLDGMIIQGKKVINPAIEKSSGVCKYDTPPYQAAIYGFFKLYNMYFNDPLDEKVF